LAVFPMKEASCGCRLSRKVKVRRVTIECGTLSKPRVAEKP